MTGRGEEGLLIERVRTSRYGLFAIILVNMIWAASFPATAVALGSASAWFLTTLRLGSAALLLSPFLWVAAVRRMTLRTALMSLALGTIGFTAPVYLETEGMALSTPAMAAVSIAIEPLFTAIIASFVFHERLPVSRRVALVIALVGAWTIAGFPRPGALGYGLGDLLLILSVLTYATYNVYSKRLTTYIPVTSAAAATILGGFLTSLPIWWLTGAAVPHHVTPYTVGAMAYLALLATAGAYLLWLFSLQSFKASVAALFLYLQPVFGVLLSVLIVGVHPPPYFYLGAACILLGIFVGQRG